MDVAKITCRQLFFDKLISPNEKSLALWLSGYYNAKRNNTVLDLGALAKNVDKVEDYCRMNEDVTVMDAVTKALSPANNRARRTSFGRAACAEILAVAKRRAAPGGAVHRRPNNLSSSQKSRPLLLFC